MRSVNADPLHLPDANAPGSQFCATFGASLGGIDDCACVDCHSLNVMQVVDI